MDVSNLGAFFVVLTFTIFLIVWAGIKVVPQQSAWVIEKLGRFDRVLEPGLNFLIPFIEIVAYRHSLKEYAMDVQEQTAITRDNVPLILDGVIYLRVIDPKAASYGVSNAVFAITQLAQTTMRSQIGQMSMDQSFEERERLNANIVAAINEAAQTWGIQCMRYEIKNISPPPSVQKAMELQMAAERQKRALILESEGKRQSQINLAEGKKQEIVLNSEASLTDQVNRAKGEAEAIISVAQANAEAITMVAKAIQENGGADAVSFKVAEQYVGAFKELAKESTTVLLPANAGDAGSMVAQALTIFENLRTKSSDGAQSPQNPWKAK